MEDGSRTMMCGRGTPSSSTSSSSLATIVVVSETGFGSFSAEDDDGIVGFGMLSGGSGSGAERGGAEAMTLLAAVDGEVVLNTGAEVAIVVTVAAAAGVLREGNGVIDGAGSGELRWENGPDEAADDMGMGCSLSMLISAALPELLGD